MDALKAIRTRVSVRDFTGEGISQDKLRQIIEAGMSAPSAHGMRPWRILTITDNKKMRKLIPFSPWWGLLENAAVLIAVCAEPGNQKEISHEFRVDGCAAAAENMLLAAHAMEMGGVWLGVCEGEDNCEPVKKELGIPHDIELICMLAIGQPVNSIKKAPCRMEHEKWYQEIWGDHAKPNE